MLGTLVNAGAIFIGALIGMIVKGNLKEKYRTIMLQSVGLSVLFIGLSSALSKMILPEAHPVLFIISMVLGGVVGTLLNIEGGLKNIGDFLERRFAGKESGVSDGFVKASLLFCVGTMAILGAIQSGVQGEHTILFAKSALDGITSIIFASTMGAGVLLSAVSVLLYQGFLTMLARLIEPWMTQDMLREIGIIGGILITGLGLDMMEIKRIQCGNLLPAVLVPVIFYLIFA